MHLICILNYIAVSTLIAKCEKKKRKKDEADKLNTISNAYDKSDIKPTTTNKNNKC